MIGWARETVRKFAGRGDTTGMSGDGEEGFVAELTLENFQNSLYKNGPIGRAVYLPAGGFIYCFFGLSRFPRDAERTAQESRCEKIAGGNSGLACFDRESGYPPPGSTPISLSESMPCLEVRSGGKQIYPV